MAQPKLVINLETLDQLRAGQSWSNFADHIGVNKGTLSRIRHGISQPGPEFIAKVVTVYPVRMDEVVSVVAA